MNKGGLNSYENFKIPFFIVGRTVQKKIIKSLKSSMDIPATICDIMGIPLPKSFDGESVLFRDDDKILTIEYCGGGCPDINEKRLMLAAFDKNYMVATMFYIEEPYKDTDIVEVYNLRDDPEQKKNLVGKINLEYLQRYIEIIHTAHIIIHI